MASSADYALATAKGETDLFRPLHSDDRVELALRHIAAYIYESRTRDKIGAAHIRGVVAPGSGVDVAPAWLFQDATELSRAELQRDERTHNATKRKGKGKDKGKGGQKLPAGLTLASQTPSGEAICYDYNNPSRRCQAQPCRFKHVCQLCFKEKHSWSNCEIYKEALKKGKTTG